ncbi:MAG: hypothetical protein ABSG46_10160 [Candidatus Binataceae bacterium]
MGALKSVSETLMPSQLAWRRLLRQGKSVRSRHSKKKRSLLTILISAAAFFACGRLLQAAALASPADSSSSAIAAGGTCRANAAPNAANDTQYLVFWTPLPGATPDSLGESVKAFATKLGTTGDGKTRQLGFGVTLPFFVSDEAQTIQAIAEGFEIARRTNVAVHFNFDDHIRWDGRPDLWNWYDPAKPGYNPENKKNVEWYDWDGTPNKRRYLTPAGVPSQAPHMCYNSPAILTQISRIVSLVIGPTFSKEIDELKQENRGYLFAGITVGAELGFDDYSRIPRLSSIPPNLDPVHKQFLKMLVRANQMMDADGAPHSRLGYCSLTNAGYSKTNPPADFDAALADVNRKFIAFWDKQFFDNGIPCSRLYTHVPASAPQDDTNDDPISNAFNLYARPGWTTYPVETLADGFEPLYQELAEHGNPAWGGVEANASFGDPGGAARVSWEEYLAWHYNHGARLVGINVGAADQSLVSSLSNAAFSDQAIAAYKKFLNGEKLIGK